MPAPIPPFPTLSYRLESPDPLTWEEGDDNLKALRQYMLAVVAYIQGALNSDGTLVQGSVGAAALQAASVGLAALNPALLYQIVPVDNDTGTVANQYVITARGGAGTGNIISGGATYDVNGNYVLPGLTLNYGYFWTPGANDASIVSTPPLTAAGAFQSAATTIQLTGTPNAPVTASVVQSAPVSAYKNSQIFFVWTTRVNTGPSTLNVNNLGAIPIQFYGQQLQGAQIGAPGVFAVVYMNGAFSIFVGAQPPSSSSGNGTIITTTGFNGVNQFTSPATALATSGFPNAILTMAHGLGSVPTQFQAVLQCLAVDSGFAQGQEVTIGEFSNNGAGPAFAWSFDSTNIYVVQLSAAYVVNPSTGALVAITPANWSLVVAVSTQVNYSGQSVFPALNYEIANPHGAFCYGTSMITFNKDTNGNAGKMYINLVNILNNEVTPINQSAVNLANVNGAVFSGAFFGLSLPQFVFETSAGLYRLPVTNPGTNIISTNQAYNSSGQATVTLVAATAYVWTPGPNDVSLTVGGTTYLASSATNGTIAFNSGVNTTGTLTGAPNTVITGTIYTNTDTSSWAPVQLFTSLQNTTYKPVWVGGSGGQIYLVNGSFGGGTVSSLSCQQVSSGGAKVNGTWANNNASVLNLTNSNIVNASNFGIWYPSNTGAPLILFQYNPISQRIYVITTEMSMIHIFELTTVSNDFSAWWNTASPAREQALTYVKTLMLAGMGRNVSTGGQCHYTVDYDPVSGKERAMVFTRDGGNQNIGSITRISWTE